VHRDGQRNENDKRDREVRKPMASSIELAGGHMGEKIAQEKYSLEEQQGRVPNLRRPTERGEDHLGRHRLHDEQQGRTQEGGGKKEQTHGGSTILADICPRALIRRHCPYVYYSIGRVYKVRIVDYQSGKELRDVALALTDEELDDLALYLKRLRRDRRLHQAHLTQIVGSRLERELTVVRDLFVPQPV
jgi:hypothetical protein